MKTIEQINKEIKELQDDIQGIKNGMVDDESIELLTEPLQEAEKQLAKLLDERKEIEDSKKKEVEKSEKKEIEKSEKKENVKVEDAKSILNTKQPLTIQWLNKEGDLRTDWFKNGKDLEIFISSNPKNKIVRISQTDCYGQGCNIVKKLLDVHENPISFRKFYVKPKEQHKTNIKIKAGDIIDTLGNSNMQSPVTVIKISGNSLYLKDANGIDYSAFSIGTAKELILAGKWKIIGNNNKSQNKGTSETKKRSQKKTTKKEPQYKVGDRVYSEIAEEEGAITEIENTKKGYLYTIEFDDGGEMIDDGEYIKPVENKKEQEKKNEKNIDCGKYVLGMRWNEHFPYRDMLKCGKKTSIDWGVEKLRELAESYQDVNYHEVSHNLWDAIEYLEKNDTEKAKESLLQFHKDIEKEFEEEGEEEENDENKGEFFNYNGIMLRGIRPFINQEERDKAFNEWTDVGICSKEKRSDKCGIDYDYDDFYRIAKEHGYGEMEIFEDKNGNQYVPFGNALGWIGGNEKPNYFVKAQKKESPKKNKTNNVNDKLLVISNNLSALRIRINVINEEIGKIIDEIKSIKQ